MQIATVDLELLKLKWQGKSRDQYNQGEVAQPGSRVLPYSVLEWECCLIAKE